MEVDFKKYILIISVILVLVFGSFLVNNKREEKVESENFIIVHIAGAIKNPGVYKLLEGSRVIDGIQAAGGALPSADLDKLNLAEYLEDGCKIFVPEKILLLDLSLKSKRAIMGPNPSNNKININYASERELENLPGIGPSLAKRIVEYREQNGPFKSLKDLKRVKGIGEKRIDQIKDLIEW